MAKVIMPLLSGRVAGKVGDIVFFNRGGMQLARMRVVPANPNTQKQIITRANIKALAQAWAGSLDKVLLKKVNKATWQTTDICISKLTSQQKQAFGKIYLFIKSAMTNLMNNENPEGVTIVSCD